MGRSIKNSDSGSEKTESRATTTSSTTTKMGFGPELQRRNVLAEDVTVEAYRLPTARLTSLN
jgi:hypothetical protein